MIDRNKFKIKLKGPLYQGYMKLIREIPYQKGAIEVVYDRSSEKTSFNSLGGANEGVSYQLSSGTSQPANIHEGNDLRFQEAKQQHFDKLLSKQHLCPQINYSDPENKVVLWGSFNSYQTCNQYKNLRSITKQMKAKKDQYFKLLKPFVNESTFSGESSDSILNKLFYYNILRADFKNSMIKEIAGRNAKYKLSVKPEDDLNELISIPPLLWAYQKICENNGYSNYSLCKAKYPKLKERLTNFFDNSAHMGTQELTKLFLLSGADYSVTLEDGKMQVQDITCKE